MAVVSKRVDSNLREFYAVLASAAAKRAVHFITYGARPSEAEPYAAAVEKWLAKAGAMATSYRFRMPTL